MRALVDAEVGGHVGGLVVSLDGAEGVEDLGGGAAGLGADGALAARGVVGGGGGAARFEPRKVKEELKDLFHETL